MSYFVTEMCIHVHIFATKGTVLDMGQVHCGIYELGQLRGYGSSYRG